MIKGKKDKNVSVQLSLSSIFDEISSIQHLFKFKDDPQFLALQIDDLKTLTQFAASQYTNKARTILNLSKQFTKSIQLTAQGVNEIDLQLWQMPQTSYPELAYETMKRTTSLDLDEQVNQQLDWRTVQTEYQLKFLESKNIEGLLDWDSCYNSQERCFQITKAAKTQNSTNKYSNQKQIQITLVLKMQVPLIVWHIKQVLYHNNYHLQLHDYYQNYLMKWIYQQNHNNKQESDKHVLNILCRSINYIDVILLFSELKAKQFNRQLEDNQDKNSILNLFDKKEMNQYSYLKGKTVKVRFLMPYSEFSPSLILRVNDLNVLKIQFTSQKQNQILLKIKLKNKSQEMTLKKLFGTIKKTKLTLQKFFEISHEVLRCLQTYEGFVSQRVEPYKIDLFLANRSTYIMAYLRSLNATLLEQQVSKLKQVQKQICQSQKFSQTIISGLSIIFVSKQFSELPPLIVTLSHYPQMLLKTQSTEFGFINMFFRKHQNITYEQVMYHMHFLELIERKQTHDNWHLKLMYVDIYVNNDAICYKFKQPVIRKPPNQGLIIKKNDTTKQDMMAQALKEYSLHVKISQNFKQVHFIFSAPTPNEQRKSDQTISSTTRVDGNMHRPANRVSQNEIPDKYFKSTWKEYMKKRQSSELLKDEYLDIQQLLRATHYVLNHLDFNRYIKGKAGIFRTEDMVQLMDE